MSHSHESSPDELPEQLAAILEESSAAELRQLIHHAQKRLGEHPPLTNAIEAREGEDLVRVEDHGAYSIVVVKRPDQTGEERGPFAYRVSWEPDVDDGDGKYRWHYLGQVHESGEV